MNDIFNDIFRETKDSITFKLISSNHPLDLYLGYNNNGKRTLALIVDNVDKFFQSTKLIEVTITKRKDEKTAVCFSLIDDSEIDIFYKFCEDIFESTKTIVKTDGLKIINNRWNRWINMFKNPHLLILGEKEIRGLIGELIFLKEYMFKHYSQEEAINSWVGPESAHKDFEINSTWYEVKTCYQSSKVIKISSINQLDSEIDGHLCVIELEDSNKYVNGNLQLNSIINDVSNMLHSEVLKQIFLEKLSKVGYSYFEEYNNHVYTYKKLRSYSVNDSFPRLKKDFLPKEIANVSYELLIPNLRDFLEEV